MKMCKNNQFLIIIFLFLFGICRMKTYSVLGVSQSELKNVKESEHNNRNQCLIENNDTLTCNYIPSSVPKGISRVQITDFLTEHKRLQVNTSNFADGWEYVTHLTMTDALNTDTTLLEFTARSFNNLKSLRTLAMHIVPKFLLDLRTFIGLDNVTTLDMSQCAWLGLDTLASALDSDDSLPLLESLIISQISYKNGPLILDLSGYHKLANKTNFKVIEISSTQFSMIYPHPLSAFKYLEVINLSYSHLLEMSTWLPDVRSITHIKLSDIAYVVLPILNIIIPPKVENKHFDLDPIELVSFIFTPKVINVSGIITRTPIWIKNCTATFTGDWNVHVQEIIAKQNNITYADLNVDCKGFGITSVLSVDISQSGIQFLHPNFLCSVPNIKRINLAGNKLSVMAEVNILLFQNLFKGHPNLQDIILSANRLNFIPRNMFKENTNVELIDISNNLLNHISFELSHASKLLVLLLHNNQIHILDSTSITDLMNIPQMSLPQRNQTNFTVTLYGNPLSCAQCGMKQYLLWLVSTGLVGNKYLRCYSEEGNTRDIDGLVLNYVENICRRQLTIISSCVSGGVILLVLAISLVKIYKRYRNAKKTKNYAKALHLLEKGQNQYEFAVFLSYSSSDDDFVKHSVIKQLEESLKETTGIDRTLICEGDLVLRPGFHVLDETIHCIQRSSVVIVIVSDHFCESPYCHTELYQAYDLKKPILLILKEKVDENIMSPVMKLLFKRNVRVLFENINGEYVLKTTWENVCKSIIDLIADQI